MRTIILISIVLVCFSSAASAQDTITGSFPTLSDQHVKLVGYDGFNTYTIDRVMVDANGYFKLSFSKEDYGMGYLETGEQEAYIVILAPGEHLQLKGEALSLPQKVSIQSGRQNKLFEQYANEHPRREQALSAWVFLENIYRQDSLFATHDTPKAAIDQEMQRIRVEDAAFLAGLPPDDYVSWFLPVRKLVSSVSTIAQYRTEEIPEAINAFREMDYTDTRLWKSGLLRETIDAHFWLIENSGRSLDSVYVKMNTSIDHMMQNLAEHEQKFNEITDYLFNLLERRSLFGASEYLALKVLNEVSCTVDDHLAAQLESYRAMKTGKTAPDFAFPKNVIAPGFQAEKIPQKLSDINSQYTVLVFGASWCPACHNELLEVAGLYEKWKQYDVEVVYVSLDEDWQSFKSFAGAFPFISISDYQKWDSPIVQAYHIFATPTMYLLDSEQEILLRPNSFRQMDAWVNWFLMQGNR